VTDNQRYARETNHSGRGALISKGKADWQCGKPDYLVGQIYSCSSTMLANRFPLPMRAPALSYVYPLGL
jgi:hypothetical protein